MQRFSLWWAVFALALGFSYSAPAAADENPIAAARHQGVVTPTGLRFRSEYVLRWSLAPSFDLAFPLPAGTTLDPSAEVEPVTRAGLIVGFRVLTPGALLGRVVVTGTEPLDRQGNALRVAAPLEGLGPR